MLKNLDHIPVALSDRRALLMQSTGLILHEIGHVIAAAFASGIATDYLIIDESVDAKRHGTYIHESNRDLFARNRTAQVRIAAGGFAAEDMIFGEAFLNTSIDDLRFIADLLTINFDESQAPSLAGHVKRAFGPLIPIDASEIACDMYRLVTAAIESRRYQFKHAHMIPFHVLAHPELPIPEPAQVAAAERTREGSDRGMILATLRNGVRTG
jgi:hypothetical protein